MNDLCREMQERILDFVLGLLDDTQAEAVRGHLDECPGCRRYAQRLEQQEEALAAMGDAVQAGMADRREHAVEAFHTAGPAQEQADAVRPRVGGWIHIAVAALVVLGVGLTIGRLTAPEPVNVEQLRAELRTVVQQTVLTEVDRRVESALTTGMAQVKLDLVEEMRQDLRTFAAEMASSSEQMMDQRFTEFVQLLEAARRKDRQQVARALDYIETNRRRDKTQIGMGLQSLAALTKPNPERTAN